MQKITDIRSNTVPTTTVAVIYDHPACPELLIQFQQISLPELMDSVSHMCSSSSPLDILTTSLLKVVMGAISPSLLHIINCSLISGCVPNYFKHISIQLLLKKPNPDQSLPQSYRPISKQNSNQNSQKMS